MNYEVNNNTTNIYFYFFCTAEQDEVSIANVLSCDVNDKEAKLLDS